MESVTELRVRYAETDAMGIVHHAAYIVWLELGRSDLLRNLGSGYPEWERRGIHMTVAGLEMTYRAPCRYDELVRVRTRILEAGRRKVVFGYGLERGGVRLAEGRSLHLVTGPDGRARTLPQDLLDLLLSAGPARSGGPG
ncbi:MAG: thioesterase family protein [Holophagaceae bacterium]